MVSSPVRRLASTLLALGAAVGITACVIDFGDDEPCAAFAIAATFLVNPQTLACEDHTPTCGCGGCPDDPDQPTWGFCQSACTGLSQQACAAADGCRLAWDDTCFFTDAICTLPDNGYYGCFAVDMTGPVQGACENLGADACSRHDDCMASYRRDARCTNATDDDLDGLVDEHDECLTFATCFAEQR